jgi:hypothetical protein
MIPVQHINLRDRLSVIHSIRHMAVVARVRHVSAAAAFMMNLSSTRVNGEDVISMPPVPVEFSNLDAVF